MILQQWTLDNEEEIFCWLQKLFAINPLEELNRSFFGGFIGYWRLYPQVVVIDEAVLGGVAIQ